MSALSELYLAAARHHLDALLVIALTAAGCLISFNRATRGGAERDFSAGGCALALGLALAGALLAGSFGLEEAAVPTRAVTLAFTVLLSAATLFAAARIALLRAELRGHADAERQLQKAKSDADEANRAKSDFLAVMSHEIRTPLNAVMGFANLLGESRLDDTQRSYVTTILSEGARLGTLMNDILDLTKIEKGRLALECVPFGPAETAQDVVRLFTPRAVQRQLELRFAPEFSGSLIVEGDPLRFRQILVNLVDNALKFTPRGSVTIRMGWSPPEKSTALGRLAVRVTDTGIGIPSEKVGQLFQMFSQADSSTTRRYGGTGLGLAICQRLTHLMGGEIAVRSEPGQGTEFSLVVPLLPFAPQEPAPRRADASRESTTRSLKPFPQHA